MILIDRIEEGKVPVEEFIEKYEKPYKPVIIRGIQKDWKAQHKWTIEVFFSFNNWHHRFLTVFNFY